MRITLKQAGTFFLVSAIGSTGFATQPGFYMGLGIGNSNLHNVPAIVNTTPPTMTTPTNTGMGGRLFWGVGVSQYFAFEWGYSYYSPSKYSALNTSAYIRENNFDVAGKVMYPLGKWNVFAKGGLAYVFQSVSSALVMSSPGNTVHPEIGLGVGYNITPSWAVDLSGNRITKGGGGFQNADFVALSVSYHWVDAYCGQFLC